MASEWPTLSGTNTDPGTFFGALYTENLKKKLVNQVSADSALLWLQQFGLTPHSIGAPDIRNDDNSWWTLQDFSKFYDCPAEKNASNVFREDCLAMGVANSAVGFPKFVQVSEHMQRFISSPERTQKIFLGHTSSDKSHWTLLDHITSYIMKMLEYRSQLDLEEAKLKGFQLRQKKYAEAHGQSNPFFRMWERSDKWAAACLLYLRIYAIFLGLQNGEQVSGKQASSKRPGEDLESEKTKQAKTGDASTTAPMRKKGKSIAEPLTSTYKSPAVEDGEESDKGPAAPPKAAPPKHTPKTPSPLQNEISQDSSGKTTGSEDKQDSSKDEQKEVDAQITGKSPFGDPQTTAVVNPYSSTSDELYGKYMRHYTGLPTLPPGSQVPPPSIFDTWNADPTALPADIDEPLYGPPRPGPLPSTVMADAGTIHLPHLGIHSAPSEGMAEAIARIPAVWPPRSDVPSAPTTTISGIPSTPANDTATGSVTTWPPNTTTTISSSPADNNATTTGSSGPSAPAENTTSSGTWTWTWPETTTTTSSGIPSTPANDTATGSVTTWPPTTTRTISGTPAVNSTLTSAFGITGPRLLTPGAPITSISGWHMPSPHSGEPSSSTGVLATTPAPTTSGVPATTPPPTLPTPAPTPPSVPVTESAPTATPPVSYPALDPNWMTTQPFTPAISSSNTSVFASMPIRPATATGPTSTVWPPPSTTPAPAPAPATATAPISGGGGVAPQVQPPQVQPPQVQPPQTQQADVAAPAAPFDPYSNTIAMTEAPPPPPPKKRGFWPWGR
ncbi:hypothetical protein F4821DRAFT_256729 [Hypoxylon rubiginosum]|uniref:Uncharacterized protein n=1 Tax=Hypoxylon rubiginosum TaxID=110542 RepID=A0ACC0DAR5_9PEZI|nr:hypothetical protein F4821DRAFT_256729 [Hypoxylon rubiginosum]